MALAGDTRIRTALSWRRDAPHDDGLSLNRASAFVVGVQCAEYLPRTWVRALTTSLVKSTIKLPDNFLMTRRL